MRYSIDGYNYLFRRFKKNRRLQPKLKEYREKLNEYLKEQYMVKLNENDEVTDINEHHIINIEEENIDSPLEIMKLGQKTLHQLDSEVSIPPSDNEYLNHLQTELYNLKTELKIKMNELVREFGEEVPSDNVPLDNIPSDNVLLDNILSQEVPSDNIPSDNVLSDNVLLDNVLSQEVPSDNVLLDNVLSDNVLSQEVLSDNVLSDNIPSDCVLSQEVPQQEVPSEEKNKKKKKRSQKKSKKKNFKIY